MKPTKEQIEAALRHIDEESTMQDMAILKRSKTSAANILAAAYRELLAENNELQEELHNRIVESFLP
jgi:translation initiation factor 2 alpha subunit (eIF-2alpha)